MEGLARNLEQRVKIWNVLTVVAGECVWRIAVPSRKQRKNVVIIEKGCFFCLIMLS